MAYSPTYESSDVGVIVIDGVGVAMVTAIGFASLIVLTFLYVWFKKNLKK